MVDRAMIGRQAEGATITIEPESIKDFARGIGETDPLCLDEAAARAAGYSNVVAPPTFPIAFMAESMNADLFFELGLDITSIVHGGQEFEFFRPVVGGDKLTLHGRIADLWEKQGRSGNLVFVVMEAAARDMDGNPVYTSRITLISRKKPTGEEEQP